MKLEYDRSSISSNKDYNTPPKYIEVVRDFIGGRISLDPCSNNSSMVDAETEWTLPENDGLKKDWRGFKSIFVNPPYGKDSERCTSIRDWCRKCAETSEMEYAAHIFLLIPVATNTRHWKESIFPMAQDICFLSDTRVKFWEKGKENKKGSQMPCCIIHYGGKCNDKSFSEKFTKLGFCVHLENPHGEAIRRVESLNWLANQLDFAIPSGDELREILTRHYHFKNDTADAIAYSVQERK